MICNKVAWSVMRSSESSTDLGSQASSDPEGVSGIGTSDRKSGSKGEKVGRRNDASSESRQPSFSPHWHGVSGQHGVKVWSRRT